MGFILHSFEYPPVGGGISRLCEEIARGWTELYPEKITILTAASNKEFQKPANPYINNIKVTERRPFREFSALKQLYSNRGKNLFCICGIWYPEGLLATLTGIHPRIILVHGLELMPHKSAWKRQLWKNLRNKILTNADLVLANSFYTRDLAQKCAPACKAVALPLAVDHLRFSPGDAESAKKRFNVSEKTVISTVSRLFSYKGHETVFKAMASMPDQLKDKLTYLIAGSGPDINLLRTKATQYGVNANIQWLGYVDEKRLPDVYRASDLFILCSEEDISRQEVEGFGLVLLEAQACGIPVIGTQTGGIPDAIKHGEGGWLINAGDSDKLAGILIRLLEYPEEFKLAGQKARSRIEHEFTWKHYIKKFRSILEEERIIS